MSVRTRITDGIRRCIRKVIHLSGRLADRVYDARLNTDTAEYVGLEDLSISSGRKQLGMPYEPTRGRPFRKLMATLQLPKGSTFVDVGCGKGKVLLLAADYGFQRVVGLEFSHELCEVARKNVAAYRERRSGAADVEIVECDAAHYQIRDDESVFYMFNPFDGNMMAGFLGNVVASMERRPRRVWLIYHNPTCRDVVEGLGVFRQVGEYSFVVLGVPFVVYSNE